MIKGSLHENCVPVSFLNKWVLGCKCVLCVASRKRIGCGSAKGRGLLPQNNIPVNVPSKAQEPEKLQKVKVEMTMQTFNIITGCLAQLGLDGGKLLRIGCDKAGSVNLSSVAETVSGGGAPKPENTASQEPKDERREE